TRSKATYPPEVSSRFITLSISPRLVASSGPWKRLAMAIRPRGASVCSGVKVTSKGPVACSVMIGTGLLELDLDDQREGMQRFAKMAARCPRCGVKLLHPGQSHACGPFSVQQFLAGRSAAERELYRRFVALVAAAGPYELAPAKTRIAFLADVR